MRILLVNTFYYPNMIGGTEQSVKLLAEGLRERGNEVFVLTGDSEKSYIEKEIINDVNIIRLNAKNRFNFKLGKLIRKTLEFKNLVLKNQINDILEEISPDIIHTNNLFYISNIIWKLAKKKNIKIVHTLRDYWGICPKCTLLNKNCEICNKTNILCEIHKKNYKINSQNVDVVTSPSQFTLNIYNKNKLYKNIPNKLVCNAIDINLEQHRSLVSYKLNRKTNMIKFVFLGSLEIHKGVKFLIETFKKITNKNINLIICGNGSLRRYVENSCEKDIRIKYMGQVNKEEKVRILTESDVMIVPSIWYEPFGRVVIEGYKYAMPVIACNIGGISELLNKEVSEEIEANCEKNLREAIEKFSTKKCIDEYMVNTEKFIIKYDLKNQINSFNEIYKNLIKK